jgi:hypothetical protein
MDSRFSVDGPRRQRRIARAHLTLRGLGRQSHLEGFRNPILGRGDMTFRRRGFQGGRRPHPSAVSAKATAWGGREGHVAPPDRVLNLQLAVSRRYGWARP